MVYGFLGENAGAGLGLNSAASAFAGIASPAAQQPQRELFRDVLGLRGEEYSGVYRVGLRAAAPQAARDDHHHHHHPAQVQQQIQHDPGSSFVSYAHQQQQQRLHTLQRDHQDHEMLFRGTALHPTAAAAAPPPAGINRRLVDRTNIEDDYESEAEQGIWGGAAAAAAAGNRGNVPEASSENTHSYVNPTRRLDSIATPSKNIVEGSPLIDVSRQVLARESEAAAAAAAAAAAHHLQQQQHRKHHEGTTCKECGNQAKKDCQYQRCRTCCKSRAFDCQTHVRSTWVPAARRRERHGQDSIQGAGSNASMEANEGLPKPKRARHSSFQLVGSSASLTPTSSGGSPHGSETQHSAPSFRGPFPTEFRAQALFKCVKLTTVEDGEDEYAYQTTVRIGGHVFKGVLHDRGLENENVATSMSHLQLGAAKSVAPSPTLVDPVTTLYGHSGSGLLEELRDTRPGGGGNW